MSSVQLYLKEAVTVRTFVLIATFTTLVFISTSIFSVALVSSTGFFNLGESFVYISALVGGPIVGAVAGGLGSALADSYLGYGSFAMGTLIIKGLEGLSVGILYKMTKELKEKTYHLFLGIVTGFIVLLTIYFTTPAINGVAGSSTIVANFVILNNSFSFSIPGILLVFVASILSGIMWYIELTMEKSKSRMTLSCLTSGPIIVIGYYLWETVALKIPGTLALSEIPFNIAQFVFGTLIAVPVVSYLYELGIIHTDNNNFLAETNAMIESPVRFQEKNS